MCTFAFSVCKNIILKGNSRCRQKKCHDGRNDSDWNLGKHNETVRGWKWIDGEKLKSTCIPEM